MLWLSSRNRPLLIPITLACSFGARKRESNARSTFPANGQSDVGTYSRACKPLWGTFQACAGLVPLDVKIEDQQELPGYTRIKLSFVSEKIGERVDRVPAYLLIPHRASNERLPAILALHQTTPRGKAEVVLDGGPPNLQYGRELADRGYVVLAPDYPSFGDYSFDFAASGYASGTMKGIFNHMRCVDFLASRPEVDTERIGVIGHSLGGHNSLFTAVFDDRLKVVVSSCGFNSFSHTKAAS